MVLGRAVPGHTGSELRGEERMSLKASTAKRKRDVVQVKNPRTNRYVKIDRSAGKILSHKKSAGPYKGVPVARTRKTG